MWNQDMRVWTWTYVHTGTLWPLYHLFITIKQKTDHRKGWINWIWQIKSWSSGKKKRKKKCKQKAQKMPTHKWKKAALWYHTKGVCLARWKILYRNRFLEIMCKSFKTDQPLALRVLSNGKYFWRSIHFNIF